MANKSGYFTDSTGNKLFGTTLGENVYLTDGTDLETKLNNMKNSQDLMSIRETFASGTSIANAMLSIINKYGRNSMMGGFVIMGYGFCSFSFSFSDNNQGGGYVVANDKGASGTPVMYTVQYANGVCTLGYPWVNPN